MIGKAQKNYIFSKATYEAVKATQVEKYNDFLSTKGLTEDEITDGNFDALDVEYEIFAKAEIESTALAYEKLKIAEFDLIEFGLSLAPAKIRTTLEKGVNCYAEKRSDFIATVLKVDTRTIPASLL